MFRFSYGHVRWIGCGLSFIYGALGMGEDLFVRPSLFSILYMCIWNIYRITIESFKVHKHHIKMQYASISDGQNTRYFGGYIPDFMGIFMYYFQNYQIFKYVNGFIISQLIFSSFERSLMY